MTSLFFAAHETEVSPGGTEVSAKIGAWPSEADYLAGARPVFSYEAACRIPEGWTESAFEALTQAIAEDELHADRAPGERYLIDLNGRSISPSPIPARPSSSHVFNWDSVQWELPEGALAAAREGGKRGIDAAAGRARARYLTIAPGQDATYAAKYADAQHFLSGAPGPHPWVEAESAATGLTLDQAAARIKTVGDLWHNQTGPAIEAARIGGKDALAALSTTTAIDEHVASVIAQLDAI